MMYRLTDISYPIENNVPPQPDDVQRIKNSINRLADRVAPLAD
jgi:hypothetical protein